MMFEAMSAERAECAMICGEARVFDMPRERMSSAACKSGAPSDDSHAARRERRCSDAKVRTDMPMVLPSARAICTPARAQLASPSNRRP